ncbi:MAG: ATP-binding protein [Rhodocyclaceae bacterium]|nr:ATP-binding protein [Rhodocyclaceae bacterium]
MTKPSLILRIAFLVIGIEAAAFGVLGWFYVDRYGAAIEQRLHTRLKSLGAMLESEELPIGTLARTRLLGDLLGAPCLASLAIGGNGRVIVASEAAWLGLPASEVPHIDPRWLAEEAADEQFIAAAGSLTSVMRLRAGENGSLLYTTLIVISTAELEAQKRQIAFWGLAASLLFIALTSAGLVLLAQRTIARRVERSLEVLKRVETGNLAARIEVTAEDELGELQKGINAMIGKVGALLDDQRRHAEQLQEQKELLQSVIEHAPIRVFWKDAQLRYLGCNALFARDAGLARPEEVVGKSDLELSWREQAESYRADDRAVIESGQPKLDYEEPQTTPTGQLIWLHTSKVPLKDGSGQVIGVLGIYSDITERKRNAEELERYRQHLEQLVEERTAELRLAKEAAEAASRAKSIFLANMSHELRPPLNAILGFAQILARDARIPADAQQSIATINRSGSHLLALINDVLEISRIESGRLSVQRQPFDLIAALAMVEEMIRSRAEAKQLAFTVERAAGLPRHVLGDEPRLRQVLLNLLGNAVKYTEHGEVRLTVKPVAGERVRFEVSDTGPGIAAEEQERIFAAFYQTPEGVAKGEGTGLGLTISRDLVRLMGGELTVQSAPGKGSTFAFEVPLPLAEAPLMMPAPGRVQRIAPGSPVPRVLVAEDRPDNQRVVEALLTSIGCEVRTAADGRAAVALFQEWQPDLILMDMRMPVMDGYAATRAIRALPGGKRLPIIALTASAFEEDRSAVEAAGCDALLRKPIEAERLFAMLGERLGLSFEYAAPAAPAAADQGAASLAELPAPLKENLVAAAQRLDKEAVLALALSLRQDFPAAAAAIEELANAYRFDRIETLCGQPGTP